MVDDYPSNSKARPTIGPRSEEPKKVERVTSGEVIRQKKSWRKRFNENFVGGDARSVSSYVFLDVLIPAAKDAISDAISGGIEKMLFGEARSSSRRSARGYGSNNSYTSYNRFTPNSPLGRRDEPRGPSRRARATHDFDEIVLATRVEAEEVVDRLFNLVSQYESATVADLYDMVGVTGNYTDDKWGWTDIRGAGVTRVRNGYLLDLPKPEPLD
jgi:hypothetical protein